MSSSYPYCFMTTLLHYLNNVFPNVYFEDGKQWNGLKVTELCVNIMFLVGTYKSEAYKIKSEEFRTKYYTYKKYISYKFFHQLKISPISNTSYLFVKNKYFR